MAIDRKYGYVTTERSTIGDDEPVVVFRAQDMLLPAVLEYYRLLCVDAGSPTHHVAGIQAVRGDVERWQAEHHTQVPRSLPIA